MAAENLNPGASQEEKSSAQASRGGREPPAPGKQPDVQQASSQPSEQQSGGRSSAMARRAPLTPSLFGAGLPSPLGLMRRMMEDMDRMFDDFGFGRGLSSQRSEGAAGALWWPQVEVLERGGALVVRADLPGMKQDDIRVEVQNDTLLLEGERNIEHQEEQGGVWRSERSYGTFRRTIPLPEGVDVESATARFENGVLEISLKLPQGQQRGRRIEVKGGSTVEGQKAAEARGKQKEPVH